MAATSASPSVLFRVAAGPRTGYGHLVRALSLAEALLVEARLSIRGGKAASDVARRLGARVVPGTSARRVLAREKPAVLIVDDREARQTRAWRRAAREQGVPVVGIHDLGLGEGGPVDLLVDGSLVQQTRATGGAKRLTGPRFAVLAAGVRRARLSARRPADPVVVITLGGGPRRVVAQRIARDICRRHATVRVRVGGGFAGDGTGPRHDRIQSLDSRRLASELAAAQVALVGGGVTLYEAAAIGAPLVAASVVPSQRPTIRAAEALGICLDGGALDASGAVARLARTVVALLEDRRRREALRAAGRRVVDGRGAERVAAAITRLMHRDGERHR